MPTDPSYVYYGNITVFFRFTVIEVYFFLNNSEKRRNCGNFSYYYQSQYFNLAHFLNAVRTTVGLR